MVTRFPEGVCVKSPEAKDFVVEILEYDESVEIALNATYRHGLGVRDENQQEKTCYAFHGVHSSCLKNIDPQHPPDEEEGDGGND